MLGVVAALPLVAQESFEPPKALSSDRYTSIWERSPFETKTIPGPALAAHSFAENLSLGGFTDDEGLVTVYLKDKTSGEYTKITSKEPSDSGISFEKIVEDPDPRLVKVSVRKGAETAEVGYSMEKVAAPASPNGGPAAAASALSRKPQTGPQGSAGPPPPVGGDPAQQQQKSRRRIILPESAPPQASTRSSFLPGSSSAEADRPVLIAVASPEQDLSSIR
jgi:hypothetical protein